MNNWYWSALGDYFTSCRNTGYIVPTTGPPGPCGRAGLPNLPGLPGGKWRGYGRRGPTGPIGEYLALESVLIRQIEEGPRYVYRKLCIADLSDNPGEHNWKQELNTLLWYTYQLANGVFVYQDQVGLGLYRWPEEVAPVPIVQWLPRCKSARKIVYRE